MESFKSLGQINLPDVRNLHWMVRDNQKGLEEPLTLEILYHELEALELNETIDEKVRSQFNVVRNLAIYSWYSYSFHQVAELKAFSTVEYSLRQKIDDEFGFKKLLKEATQRGLIADEHFSCIPETFDKKGGYSAHLVEYLPYFRNELAHGSTLLAPTSLETLRLCRDLIDMVLR